MTHSSGNTVAMEDLVYDYVEDGIGEGGVVRDVRRIEEIEVENSIGNVRAGMKRKREETTRQICSMECIIPTPIGESNKLLAIRQKIPDIDNPIVRTLALTHRSYSHRVGTNYERLEFLGDRVLSFVCQLIALSRRTVLKLPISVSNITTAVNYLVRNTVLSCFAEVAGFRELCRTRNTLKGKDLADLVESYAAGLYLEGGVNKARIFVDALMGELLDQLLQAVGKERKDLRKCCVKHFCTLLPDFVVFQLFAIDGRHPKKSTVARREQLYGKLQKSMFHTDDASKQLKQFAEKNNMELRVWIGQIGHMLSHATVSLNGVIYGTGTDLDLNKSLDLAAMAALDKLRSEGRLLL
ncbi:10475_t:CDS:2 [Paraglomus brasilianum]|uniref:10475_t:CDS:1 n=1 Tax=Paraglomus brasilianum TaxID=144538 RepID=A0A9N9A0W0_9GLOM|nr:10475_t:CDS:2 [Paraglomus brasilianum]